MKEDHQVFMLLSNLMKLRWKVGGAEGAGEAGGVGAGLTDNW